MSNKHTIMTLWKDFSDILSEHEEIDKRTYDLAELIFFTAAKLSFTLVSEAMHQGVYTGMRTLEHNDLLCEDYLSKHDPLN